MSETLSERPCVCGCPEYVHFADCMDECNGTKPDGSSCNCKLFSPATSLPATPPTPDRAAVREADTRLALSILEKILGGLGYARTERNAEKQDAQYDELARALGVDFERTKMHPYPADIVRALADALLSRAQPAAEPVAWGVVDSRGTMCLSEVEKTRKLMAHLAWCDKKFPEDAPHTLVPLYTHPAPSGGEAAPRPETGEVRDIREARLAPLRSVAVQVMKLGRTCSRDEVIEIVHEMMETVHRQEVGA